MSSDFPAEGKGRYLEILGHQINSTHACTSHTSLRPACSRPNRLQGALREREAQALPHAVRATPGAPQCVLGWRREPAEAPPLRPNLSSHSPFQAMSALPSRKHLGAVERRWLRAGHRPWSRRDSRLTGTVTRTHAQPTRSRPRPSVSWPRTWVALGASQSDREGSRCSTRSG